MSEANYEIRGGDAKSRVPAPILPYLPRSPKNYTPKIGLIGCGGITEAHLQAYQAAGYHVAALCDLVEKKAQERADAFYPGARVTADPGEILADAAIEVVDIATHPAERFPLIEAALRAGKHVLSQKPFVLDLDEGERLVALADSHGRRLAVNQNGRWAPHVSYIRHAIQAGHIGEVLGVHFSIHWNHDWTAGTPFDEIDHLILYDFAIHWFDMLTLYMGDRQPKRVFASYTQAKGQKAKPPLLAQALVEYDGAQATLVFDAFTRFGPRDTTFVAGTEGSLRSEGPDLGRQSVVLTTAAGVAEPALKGQWFPDGFHGTMGELLCAVEEGREPSNSARGNLRSLALCFAAMRSAETGLPQVPGQVRRAG